MSLAMENNQVVIGRPVIPREHGAWFMLCMPMVAVLSGAGANGIRAGLLIVAAISAFCGQHTAGLILRGRGDGQAQLWMGIYGAAFGLSSGLLLGFYGLFDLLWIGTPAASVMLWQLVRSRFSRKRLDRSISGELLAIAGLTLTAPGAYVVATGTLSSSAIGLWGLFVLYFGSSVFFVKMHILSAQKKEALQWGDRLHLGGGLLVYHAVVAVHLVAFYLTGAPAGALLMLGFAPVMVRAVWGWVRLSHQLPNLKRVGLIESIYTLWFSGCVAAVLRLALI